MATNLKCPRCEANLELEKHKGLDVDRCPECKGMWLDHHELGHLEDTVVEAGFAKGTMWMRSFGSDLVCPRCSEHMNWFRYRRFDLEIDHCPQEHGFWLDAGEERRVLEIMEQRKSDLKRSVSAQQQWDKFLNGVGHDSFFDKVKRFFRGR